MLTVLPSFTDLGTVVIGEVREDVTLRCGNVSGSRGLVTWYRNDSQPVFLLSSNSSLPAASPRFSLEDAGALHIEALSLEDDGSYTCQEELNETRWFPVWLRVASKWGWWGWACGCIQTPRGKSSPSGV